VARSVLVKTALYGADPNWGRVLAAAGAAGVPLNTDRLSLQASGGDGGSGAWLTLATGGATAHPDPGQARAIFQEKTVRLRRRLALHRGRGLLRHEHRRSGEQRQCEERATNHWVIPPEV